ncbi:MAG: hypothetical protein ACLFTT_09805 [Candidatus Hydrogenedentota bacterium]
MRLGLFFVGGILVAIGCGLCVLSLVAYQPETAHATAVEANETDAPAAAIDVDVCYTGYTLGVVGIVAGIGLVMLGVGRY